MQGRGLQTDNDLTQSHKEEAVTETSQEPWALDSPGPFSLRQGGLSWQDLEVGVGSAGEGADATAQNPPIIIQQTPGSEEISKKETRPSPHGAPSLLGKRRSAKKSQINVAL